MHVRWWVHTHGARGVHGWVGSIAEVQGAWGGQDGLSLIE